MNEVLTKEDVIAVIKSFRDCLGTCEVSMPEKEWTLSGVLIQVGAELLDVSEDRMLELLEEKHE